MSRIDDGPKKGRGGRAANGTPSDYPDDKSLDQLKEFAPPSVTREDLEELWVRHKGDETIIREEIMKWWEEGVSTWTKVGKDKDRETAKAGRGRGSAGRGSGAGRGDKAGRAPGAQGGAGRGRSAPPGGRGGGPGAGRGAGRGSGASSRSTSVGPDRGALGVAPESLAPVDPITTTTTAATTVPASGVKPIGNGGPPGEGPWSQSRNHAGLVSAGGVTVPGNVTTVAAIEAGGTWSTATKAKPATTTAQPQPTGTSGVIGAPGTSSAPAPPSNPATSGSSWLKIVSQPRPAPVPPPAPQPQAQPPKPPVPPQVPSPQVQTQVVEDMSSLAPVAADEDVAVEVGSGLSASDKTVGPPGKGAPSATVQRGAAPKRATTAPQPAKTTGSTPPPAPTYKAKAPSSGAQDGSFEEVRPGDENAGGPAGVSEGLQRLKLGKWDTPLTAGDSGNILFGAFQTGTDETPTNSKTPIGGANLWTATSSPTPATQAPTQASSPLVGPKKTPPQAPPPGTFQSFPETSSNVSQSSAGRTPAPPPGLAPPLSGGLDQAGSAGGKQQGEQLNLQSQQATAQPPASSPAPVQSPSVRPQPKPQADKAAPGVSQQQGSIPQGQQLPGQLQPQQQQQQPQQQQPQSYGDHQQQQPQQPQQQQQQQQGFRGLGTASTYGNRPGAQGQGQDLSSAYGGAYPYAMGVNGAMSHYGVNPYGLGAPTGLPHAGVGAGGELEGQSSYGSSLAAVSHGTTSNVQSASIAPSNTTGQYSQQPGTQASPTPPPHTVQALQGQYAPPPGIPPYGAYTGHPYQYYGNSASFYYPGQQYTSAGQFAYPNRGGYSQAPRGQGMYGLEFQQAGSMYGHAGIDYQQTQFGNEFITNANLQGQPLPSGTGTGGKPGTHSSLGGHGGSHSHSDSSGHGMGKQSGGSFGYGSGGAGSHRAGSHSGGNVGYQRGVGGPDQGQGGWAPNPQYQGTPWVAPGGNVMAFNQGNVSGSHGAGPSGIQARTNQPQQQYPNYRHTGGSSGGQSWN